MGGCRSAPASPTRPGSAWGSTEAHRIPSIGVDTENMVLDEDCLDKAAHPQEELLDSWEQDGRNDAEFFNRLNLRHQHQTQNSADADDIEDDEHDTATQHSESDVEGFVPYLDSANALDADADSDAPVWESPEAGRPGADALNNTYVRVVHTNGIHHLAMVTCLCQGEHNIPLDLVASPLLPASFTRVRTLFTAPLLDYFRLCNLELKASAYQFYQLICRLTRPIGNAEIVNLYHEFRRMSRLWRWMKKLKWAGYGHNQEDPLHPPPGSLANYCPTCPQPGINLPGDWKSDRNRFVI